MTVHDPRVTLTEVLAAHVRLPMMHSQGCSCGWHASLSHPDLHRTHLAERIEEHIADRLSPIRALADEWERNYSNMLIAGFSGCSIGADTAAKLLRAVLDATGADLRASQECRSCDDAGYLQGGQHDGEECPACVDLTASQPHDGAEGQGEGERAGEGCEYVPKSRWTGLPNYPRWAACRCGWESDVQRTTWREASEDHREHTERATR